MNWERFVSTLCCPICQEELSFHNTHFKCNFSGKTFPLRFGIPDFRLFSPSTQGYMNEAQDLRVSTELFELHEKLSFEELIHVKIQRESEYLNIAQNLQSVYIQWRLDNHPRAMELTQWMQKRWIFCQDPEKNTLGLDIGCGSGSGMATLLELTDTAVGFDISMSSLILAKSFLEEFYPARDYILFAGVAENLPIKSEIFSLVLARDVIEHVADQNKFLQEAHRVMLPEGSFFFNTGSRFVLLEPHTRLPLVGFLPRFLQPIFVRLLKGSHYKVHLPSLWELRKWLNESPFNDTWKIIASKRIDLKNKSKGDLRRIKRLILGALRRLGFLKLLNWLLAHISYYEVIVKK